MERGFLENMDSAKPKVAYSAEEAADNMGIANPSRDEVVGALRTVLNWIGEDPAREGLLDTPDRVLRAYEELFSGYKEDPAELLQRTFEEVPGYQDMVLVKGIEVASYCEHHMMPIVGVAHVAYVPNGRVVGISKLARVVQIFSRRLPSQEQFTQRGLSALKRELPNGRFFRPARRSEINRRRRGLPAAVHGRGADACRNYRGRNWPGADAGLDERRGN